MGGEKAIALFEIYLIIGSATFAPADEGVLEKVAARRVQWGQVPADWESYEVLTATPDCRYLGKAGWLITNEGVSRALVVDCAQRQHRQVMTEGRFIDANLESRVKGWLVVR